MQLSFLLLALLPALVRAEIHTQFPDSIRYEDADVIVRAPLIPHEGKLHQIATPAFGEEKTQADRYCRSIGYLKQLEVSYRPAVISVGRFHPRLHILRIDENGKPIPLEQEEARQAKVILEVRCTKDPNKESLEAKVKSAWEVLTGRSPAPGPGAMIEGEVSVKAHPAAQVPVTAAGQPRSSDAL